MVRQVIRLGQDGLSIGQWQEALSNGDMYVLWSKLFPLSCQAVSETFLKARFFFTHITRVWEGTADGRSRYFWGTRGIWALLGTNLKVSMGPTVIVDSSTRTATRAGKSRDPRMTGPGTAAHRITPRVGVGKGMAGMERRVGDVAAQMGCCGCHWLDHWVWLDGRWCGTSGGRGVNVEIAAAMYARSIQDNNPSSALYTRGPRT